MGGYNQSTSENYIFHYTVLVLNRSFIHPYRTIFSETPVHVNIAENHLVDY